MKEIKLKVVYNVEKGIDPELDKYLEIMLAYIGFNRWASGTDMNTRDRDLAFTKRIKE